MCNDGDYEDNDLIVYCALCQLTVHQNCYGIINIPEDDWICNLCSVYSEKEKDNINCLLCSVQGGAMKLSSIKKTNINDVFMSRPITIHNCLKKIIVYSTCVLGICLESKNIFLHLD